MKTINFRPLRVHKKSGKVIVASYPQWYKVRCANYNEFVLNVINEYYTMNKTDFVYNRELELLYHLNYNPWDVFVYNGTCLDADFNWDYLSETYKSFSIDKGDGSRVMRSWRGCDCEGTPTFSHHTADSIGNGGCWDLKEWEPLTVGYVVDWLGWFLYHLENSK